MIFEKQAVELCNVALQDLGHKVPIARLVAPIGVSLTTNEQICARKYPLARRTVLRAFAWNFANKYLRVCPGHNCTCGDGEWGFRIRIPGDCLRVLRCGGRAFRVDDGWVSTNVPVHELTYTRDVEDLTVWDPLDHFASRKRILGCGCRTGAASSFLACHFGAFFVEMTGKNGGGFFHF